MPVASTISRRSLLACVIGGLGFAAMGSATIVTAAAARDDQPIRDETARALDEADVAFSQRSQLHYNRQRQHGQPPPRQRRQRRRWPHWRHR